MRPSASQQSVAASTRPSPWYRRPARSLGLHGLGKPTRRRAMVSRGVRALPQQPIQFARIASARLYYLIIVNVDLLDPSQTLTLVRLGSVRIWWWTHVATDGAVAVLLAADPAVLSVAVALAAHRWSWHWGTFGLNSATPAVLALAPWTVAWRWSLEALGYLVLGLWAMGVVRDVLAIWWRGPWLAWLTAVALGLASFALNLTFAHVAIWWLPGSQFSFTEHWTSQGSTALGWTLGYTALLLGTAAVAGLVLAEQSRWHAPHGEGP